VRLRRFLAWLLLEPRSFRRSVYVGGVIALLEFGVLLAAGLIDGNLW